MLTNLPLAEMSKHSKKCYSILFLNLARSDLAYYYKQCIDGIDEVRRKALEMLRENENDEEQPWSLTTKDKLLA
jgi:hypothetical protein